MSYFTQHDGRVFVGKDDPDPIVCPHCGEMQKVPVRPKLRIRCKHCKQSAYADEFKAEFRQVGEARVLVAV